MAGVAVLALLAVAAAGPVRSALSAGAAAGTSTVRINAGGGAYTSATGAFAADTAFSGGQTFSTTAAIAGTTDPALHQNERFGQFSYAIPVTAGTYDVRLHFAELYFTAPCNGKRVFGMDVVDTAGSNDLSSIDVCAAVGPRAALVHTIPGVNVSDGRLDIRSVVGAANNPELTAIEVVPSGPPPPDTTPPAVSVSAPAAGAALSGAVSVTATASDDVGVAGVQFTLDGATLGAEDTTAPYAAAWDTTQSAAGGHTLAAVARDAAGNTRTSSAVAVTVDNTAPAVALTAPPAGTGLSATATVSADASDDVGVAGVQFNADGVPIGAEDTTAPFSVAWSTATAGNGPHTLTAVARDAAGNRTTSAPVDVTVANAFDATNAGRKVVVGPGLVDPSTRELVRTAAGWVYIFAIDDTAMRAGTGPGVLRAWKGNQSGIPTAFSEVDAANHPSATGSTHTLCSPDLRLDANGIVQMLYVNETNGDLVYRTFSTLTDRWGPAELVATGVQGPTHSFKRESCGALVLDDAEVPHVAYVAAGAVLYRNRVGGTWSAPVTVARAALPIHMALARDASGALHLAWLNDGTSAQIAYARRAPDGTWGAAEIVAGTDVLTNSNSDQGPSIAVDDRDVPYVLYVSALPVSAVRVRYRDPSGWLSANPPTDVYTHTPQIYTRGGDVYVFLGHDVNVHYGYLYRLRGQAWSPTNVLLNEVHDGSASVRWDPQRETNAGIIDTAFWDEDKLHNSTFQSELYYMAVVPQAPPAPDTTPPTVAVSAPAAGATVSATTSVTATAGDGVGVAGVQFRLDGADLGAEDTFAPYSVAWDTTTAASGPHSLTAVARDAAGNAATSAQVAVTVSQPAPDTTPPTVALSAPAAGATVSGTTTVSATAADDVGVAGVQFKLDGANLGTEDTTAPYSVPWDTTAAANGAHTLTAVARDGAANSTTSGAAGVTAQNSTSTGLVAAYAFGETTGTSVTDASGKGNTGTISGATRTTAGKYGSALVFNGTSSRVTVPDAPSLDLTTAMTLEAWVYPTSALSGWRTILIKEQASDLAYALYANTDTNRPSAHVYTSGDLDTRGTAQLALNTWTHIAATWDGQTLRLYRNGTLASSRTVTGTIVNGSGPLRFGGNGVWGEYLAGRLDEIRVYNRALTATEVAADMNTAVGG